MSTPEAIEPTDPQTEVNPTTSAEVITALKNTIAQHETQLAALSSQVEELKTSLAAAKNEAALATWAAPIAPLGPAQPQPHTNVWQARLARIGSLQWVLAGIAILVYAITRLGQITLFPLYFFADEAIEVVLARELIARGFRDEKGNLLPVFFNAYGFQVPLVTVYFHSLTSSLFGISPEVTRITSALVTLTGVIAIGLVARLIFKLRYWWAAMLFLAITPVWFLHSRTAFETASMVSFYAWFLLFYFLYRYRSAKFIFPALLFAALTFYSYGNGQIVIGVSGILLFLADLPYHLRQWRTNLLAVGFIGLLALPYLTWRDQYPDVIANQLRRIDSYWLQPIPFTDKLSLFLQKYWQDGISPDYWFNSNVNENVRHLLKGYGHLPLFALPLFVLGLGWSVWRIIRQPLSAPHRIVLIAALAAPVGVALSGPGVTRSLMFVLPAVLFMTLGTELALNWLEKLFTRTPSTSIPLTPPTLSTPPTPPAPHTPASPSPWFTPTASVLLCTALALGSLGMWRDAVTNGQLWYRDYGLYGVQWGAQPIFTELNKRLKAIPTDVFLLTPNWANGSDVFLRFFMPGETRVRIETIDPFVNYRQSSLNLNMVFVVTPAERNLAANSGKFKPFTTEGTILYPDGTDGFYFVRLQYVDNIDAVFSADLIARRQPITETVIVGGETITVAHSKLDAGQPRDLFDGNAFSLLRGMEANPLLLDFSFPAPRTLTGIKLTFASMDMTLTAQLFAPGSNTPIEYKRTDTNLPADPTIDWTFENPPPQVQRIRILVQDLNRLEPTNIHVREVQFVGS